MVSAIAIVTMFCTILCQAGPEQNDFEAARARAFEHFNRGEIEQAVVLLKECLEQKGDDGDVLKTLGFIRYRSEDFSPARALFERALDLEGPSSYVLFMLGNIAFREFRLGDAETLYDQTAAIDPRYPSLETNQALLSDRIVRIRTLENLRKRSDRFYWAVVIAASLLLLLALRFEMKRQH